MVYFNSRIQTRILAILVILTVAIVSFNVMNIRSQECPDPAATYRPLVGGSRIQIGCGWFCLVDCTYGYSGYTLGSNYQVADYGFVLAGHCGSSEQYVYQPGWSLFSDNHVGTIQASYTSGVDALFATNLSSISIEGKILRCSSTGRANIVGTMDYFWIRNAVGSGQVLPVTKYGATTGETCGVIVETRDVLVTESRVLYYQILSSYDSSPGDSGSPVVVDYTACTCPLYEPDVYAAGVHWGRIYTSDDTSYAVASSMNSVFMYLRFEAMRGDT